MCRKFICPIFFVFVLCLTAVQAQADWNHRVAYWDASYPQAWADVSVTEALRDYLELNGYTVVNAAQLKTWMDARIADGASSVVVFCKDIVPETVAETMDATCTIRRYLDAGGKVVWYADWPFFYLGHPDGSRTTWNVAGATNVLGFNASGGPNDSGEEVVITAAGAVWGLTTTWTSRRPTPTTITENLTALATIDSGGSAAAWAKHYLPGDTYRGFVRLADFAVTPSSPVALMDDLLRVAEYMPLSPSNPAPANLAVDVPIDANLSWAPGIVALTEEVYFGTDPCQANLPLVDTLTVGVDDPLHDPPGDLIPSTTYYWYIVDVNSPNEYPGPLWSFSTIPGEATPRDPADGVEIEGEDYPDDPPYTHIWTMLIFNPGPTAVKHTGYFSDDYSK
ncbi:MAG: hypothetical protein ACYTDW_10745, partial [Planctomycetota bacterium]